MKKIHSQIAVAVVCALLGFFLSYQFKLITEKEKSTQKGNYEVTDILAEVDKLKTEKEDMKKQNEDLQAQLKKIEDEATKNGNVDLDVKKELDVTRMITGTSDVKGPGVVLTITPKNDMFSSSNTTATLLDETDLIHIVNNLWYSGAEAISINDYRITPQTGIKNSAKIINIGVEGRVDPSKEIVVKAIGEKSKFSSYSLNFANALETGNLASYKKDIVSSDEVIVKKSVKGLNSNYITPVK